MVVARIAPEPRKPGGSDAAKPTLPQVVRAVVVSSGGPLALAAWSALSPVSAARRWPQRLPRGGPRRAAWALTAAGVVAPAVYAGVVRPRLLAWGSTEEERAGRYPGDPDHEPWFRYTRAVTVHAPAEEVWRWLVQLGQDRGGFYSYDWLENLAGCRIHSADRVHEEWQHLSAGDPMTIFPGFATTFAAVDPPRSLVIEGWGSYVVEPVDERTCRLIARGHQDRAPAALMYLLAIELPHAIMEHRTLVGIKRRAEAAAHT
ncbi:MAG TPA: hypothetical protein VFZ64_13925 [Nocardioidaceae bacterium]